MNSTDIKKAKYLEERFVKFLLDVGQDDRNLVLKIQILQRDMRED